MEKFDVFLSFRGIDTGRSFVSHLYHSLIEENIRTFKNDEDQVSGNRQVPWTIQESKIAIAVISTNYTDSISCLNELATMIECKEKGSLVVVPIFYEVETSDFAKKANDLAFQLFLNHGKKEELKEVNKWRDALVDLTLVYETYAYGVEEDAEMINKVIDYISDHLTAIRSSKMSMEMEMEMEVEMTLPLQSTTSDIINFEIGDINTWSFKRDMDDKGKEEFTSVKTLLMEEYFTGEEDSVPVSRLNSFIGMDKKMEQVETLLELDSSNGVFEIGIWGMGGSGKTSLARCVSEQISSQFQDYCYYLMNNTNSNNSSSLTCLLKEITRASLITSMSQSLVTTKDFDVMKARSRFRRRKVLLVVDGIDCIGQLKCIKSVTALFGPGSRVIVVTEDKSLLVECNVKHLYEVESLRYEEALELFCQFAFKEKDMSADFDQLCLRAVLIAGCLPLALKVLGSFLCGRGMEVWEYEILRLEESRDKGFAEVSSYIKYPPKRNQYSGEDHDKDKFPSYSFVFV